MINDPELKAMSEVFESLKGLDSDTQKRVIDWVLSKLESSPLPGGAAAGAKRGPKPGSKRSGKKRGRKPLLASSLTKPFETGRDEPKTSKTGKKRGPKPGSKRKGKRGRPPGSKNKA